MPIKRCEWGNTSNQAYEKYHDEEWGKLNLDNQYLYEMLVLETFQSGLSWEIILNKRTGFHKAFANFDYHRVAEFGEKDVQYLMQDKEIIRNKMKIEAAINNAQALVKLEKKGISFAAFLKQYVPKIIVNHPQTMHDVSAKSTLSERLAKEMKKAGFKFVGPVTIYSFLQAVGLINDHLDSCSFK